jgi:hypothetical protein
LSELRFAICERSIQIHLLTWHCQKPMREHVSGAGLGVGLSPSAVTASRREGSGSAPLSASCMQAMRETDFIIQNSSFIISTISFIFNDSSGKNR